MIYDKLAIFYDRFIDDELYKEYSKLVNKYHKSGSVIDLGCGTAPLAIALAKEGFFVTATDISEAMLENAYNISVIEDVKINFYIHDILDPLNNQYDVLTMTSDVINYLDDKSKIQKTFCNISSSMHSKSIFIFDFFKVEYLDKLIGHDEDIKLENDQINWKVEKTNTTNQVKHSLNINGNIETHIQTTFEKKDYIEWLKECNLKVKKTVANNERIILLCKKETS